MQYEITLPHDYDMNIIRNRVKANGAKTDGFHSLVFKAYLIQDEPNKKMYAPLYLWENQDGMNKFIFEGFYDNILQTFGWQKIQVGIPAKIEINDAITTCKYVSIQHRDIDKTSSLRSFRFEKPVADDVVCSLVLYNPEKWRYAVICFYINKPHDAASEVFEILQLSQ